MVLLQVLRGDIQVAMGKKDLMTEQGDILARQSYIKEMFRNDTALQTHTKEIKLPSHPNPEGAMRRFSSESSIKTGKTKPTT